MDHDIKIIKTGVDQEEVATIFKDYSLLSVPVINKNGKIIGVILIEDVIKSCSTRNRRGCTENKRCIF